MKKLLTTCALIAFGTLSTFAAGGGKKIVTATDVKPAKRAKSMFILKTDEGKSIKAFAWGKMERVVKRVIRKEQTATYTLGKNKNGSFRIVHVDVD